MKKNLLLLSGALLALCGGVPLAQRLYAHLTSWGFGIPGYGPALIRLALVLAGAAVLVLAARVRPHHD
ncbi:hypothetical protein [Streptomyces sp. NPDC050528]|uniref:hypothetical protein n=1 Tax=unclassified Streptomyces TaxID=2593676 RepID=UPI0037AD9E37